MPPVINMFNNANALSEENKCAIHSSFSSNDAWPYDWSEFCAIVSGCTDPYADNYNSDANLDDGSCGYPDNGNYALSFDGSNDYVRITTETDLPLGPAVPELRVRRNDVGIVIRGREDLLCACLERAGGQGLAHLSLIHI